MRVAILGTGLIGASIGLAARRWLDAEVAGHDPDPLALEAAARRGAVEPAESAAGAAAAADLVFVCAPVAAISEAAAAALEAGARVVTDAGSVKAGIVAAVEGLGGGGAGRFVGGHPMTGSERSGPAGAAAGLIDGAAWALTPTDRTDPAALASVEDAVRRMGAVPVTLSPDRHDRLVGLVSHLPQVASIALMSTVASSADETALLLAAGGFRDLTRLAASSPELWVDILLANREAVAEALDGYGERLRSLAGMLQAGDAEGLTETFARAKEARLGLGARPQSRVGLAILAVPIPDRPGSLAEIAGALADRSVNIEDLEIVHSAEGARGTAHVTVG
ncbi:MAG TPA: prephenate dehydrogenase/arogenate dehydrogenase family protein, partial [Actinomycetota bacterium]